MIELLFATHGRDFGIEGPGGPPLELHARVSRERLVEALSGSFTVTGTWQEVEVEKPENFDPDNALHRHEGTTRWLEKVLA